MQAVLSLHVTRFTICEEVCPKGHETGLRQQPRYMIASPEML